MIRCLSVFGSLTLLAQIAYCAQTPELVFYTPITVDGNSTTATTTLRLRNPDKSALACTLVLKDFRSKNTGRDLDSVANFYGQDQKTVGPVLAAVFASDQSLSVRVDISHFIEAGESVADLLCNQARIGELKEVKELGLPFKVTLEGNPPEKPEIDLVEGAPSDLRLKNDDAMTYPLSWELFIKGKAQSGSVLAGPNGSTTITVHPDGDWFSLYQSFFKDEVVDGSLILGYKPPGATGAYPSKTIPVKAHLSYYDPASRDVWAMIVILAILAAGGGASSYANVNLVNRFRVVAINKRLGQLARVVGDIGTRLNSQLRVSLWLERERIISMLPQRGLFTAETAGALTQSSADTDVLETRVNLASQIADAIVRQTHATDTGNAPPTLMDHVTKNLQDAQDLLMKSVPGPAELQKIQEHLGNAVNILDGLGTPDESLEKEIGIRLQDLRAKFTKAVLSNRICAKIRAHAPVPFLWLDPGGDNLGTQAERDANSRKLAVIFDLIQRKVADTDILDSLRREDFGSVATVELLLREIKEDISFAKLRDAISANPPELFTEIDRDTARVKTPILMKLMFKEPRYNRAAAKRLIECTWALGDKHEEKGWEIWHYFPDPRPYPVQITFKDERQNRIPEGAPIDTVINISGPRSEGSAHKWVGVQRWAVGFFVAIIGLFAGAKDKILTFDTAGTVFAVFLLGFSIDMAKNLFVPKQG